MVTNDHVLAVDVATGDGDVFESTVDLYDVDFTGVVFNVVVRTVVDFKVVPVVDVVVDSVAGFVVTGKGCVALELDIATADDDWLPVWVW